MIKEAIKKAVEGGWDNQYYESVQNQDHSQECDKFIFLDSLFWQCLGKAEGWGNYNQTEEKEMNWKDYWHSFIDHLAAGKDPDSFFTNLLKK